MKKRQAICLVETPATQAPNVTTAQLRDAIDGALATIAAVRTLINENPLHWRHTSENFADGALMMVDSFLSDVAFISIDRESKDQARLMEVVVDAHTVMESMCEWMDSRKAIPLPVLLGTLLTLEGMLLAEIGEGQ